MVVGAYFVLEASQPPETGFPLHSLVVSIISCSRAGEDPEQLAKQNSLPACKHLPHRRNSPLSKEESWLGSYMTTEGP